MQINVQPLDYVGRSPPLRRPTPSFFGLALAFQSEIGARVAIRQTHIGIVTIGATCAADW